MKRWATNKDGFTIVELLIVVVVIAILAAITIVSYNGITGQARRSVVQSTASQVAKSVELYNLENNGSYPLNFSDLNFNQDASVQYVYTSDATTYCASVTKEDTSYYVTSSQGSPAVGKCPITNLMSNPSLESSTAGWSSHSTSLNPARVQQNGQWVLSGTRTDTAAIAMHAGYSAPSPVTIGKTYTASALISSSVARTVNIQIRQGGSGTIIRSQSHSFSAGERKRISVSGVMTTPTVHVSMRTDTGVVGETYTMDEVMLTEGAVVLPYADGNTAGWSWSGTQNLSTSSGPAL